MAQNNKSFMNFFVDMKVFTINLYNLHMLALWVWFMLKGGISNRGLLAVGCGEIIDEHHLHHDITQRELRQQREGKQ